MIVNVVDVDKMAKDDEWNNNNNVCQILNYYGRLSRFLNHLIQKAFRSFCKNYIYRSSRVWNVDAFFAVSLYPGQLAGMRRACELTNQARRVLS
jgi:hypothetical protein